MIIIALVLATGSAPLTAKSDRVAIVYNSKTKIYSIVHDGIKSRFSNAESFDTSKSDITDIKEEEYGVVVSIGRSATEGVLEHIKKTPVVFSLVSAPKYYGYHEENHVTGVSMDVPGTFYFQTLSRIFPEGGKVGFIYKSGKSRYLTTQIDALEGKYRFKSIRRQVDNATELGNALKELITKHKIKAFWMLNDPVYNSAIFNKLSSICKKYGVLLITNFEPLVTDAEAAFAISPDYFDVGVQTATVAEVILAGKSPGSIPIQVPDKTGVYINKKTVAALKIKLPRALLNVEKVTALFDQAQDSYKKGDLKGTSKLLTQILRLDRDHRGAKYLKEKIDSSRSLTLGKKYLAANKMKKAIPLLIKAAPYFAEAREQLSSVREKLKPQIKKLVGGAKKDYKRKKYKQVISDTQLVLDLDPNNKDARILLDKARKKYKAIAALQ